MAIVTFDFAAWEARYPEFSAVLQVTAQAYFNEAGLYLDNTDASPVSDVAQRSMLLNMLTAHIAAMNIGVNGQAPSPLVGRISGAAEGSVNVTAEYAAVTPGTRAWYDQTKYGAAFWAATARYRMFTYRVSPTWPR